MYSMKLAETMTFENVTLQSAFELLSFNRLNRCLLVRFAQLSI